VSAYRNKAVSGIELEVGVEKRGRRLWQMTRAVETEAGGCAGSRCLEEWHLTEPSYPCKRGNTDVTPMMMMIRMMMMMVQYLLFYLFQC
jgi:hypothetical protein